MQTSRTAVTLAALLIAAIAAEPALARHHSRVRIGIGLHFGVPLAAFPYSYYYPPPYYYYPPYYPTTVVVPSQPTVYVEQGSQPAPQPAQSYWYYCADSHAYYPYVKDCPAGWQRVAPQPG